MTTQLNLLKDMVRARKADARTKELQNAQLRRKVRTDPGGSPNASPGARAPNVMERLPAD